MQACAAWPNFGAEFKFEEVDNIQGRPQAGATGCTCTPLDSE